MNIVKAILWNICRYWAASLLTILVAHHWVTPDQQNQITVWFDGWLDLALTTLLAAAVPILFSIYVTLKNRLKIKLALLLPQHSTEAQVRALTAASPYSAVLTSNPDKALPHINQP